MNKERCKWAVQIFPNVSNPYSDCIFVEWTRRFSNYCLKHRPLARNIYDSLLLLNYLDVLTEWWALLTSAVNFIPPGTDWPTADYREFKFRRPLLVFAIK